jgi:CheY-like chemotaxis protein
MNKVILVVDDCHDYAETMALVLRDKGFRATAVTEPLDVLVYLANQPPDLIVSDVHMPGLDGVTLARRIREMGFQIPIVLMSSEPVPPVNLPGVSIARKTTEVAALITVIERQSA